MSIITNNSYTISSGDLLGRCPNCFNSGQVVKIGELTNTGTSTDVKKCTSCNRIFTKQDGAIKSLIDDTSPISSGSDIGFISTITSSTSATISAGDYSSYNTSNNVENKIDTTNQKLADMKYDLATIVQHMITLNSNLSMVINQNHTLMEKLAKDPLNGIRKAISEFNLK